MNKKTTLGDRGTKTMVMKSRSRNWGVTEDLIQQIAFNIKKDKHVMVICRLESKQAISDRLRELGVDFKVIIPDNTKRSVSSGSIHSWIYEKYQRAESLQVTEHGQYDANLFPGFWDDKNDNYFVPKRD